MAQPNPHQSSLGRNKVAPLNTPTSQPLAAHPHIEALAATTTGDASDPIMQDSLLKGIELHDKGDLPLSAHYLAISAGSGHPLGLYLYGMALRHGWGVPVDQKKGYDFLRQSAQRLMSVLTLPDADKLVRRFSLVPLPRTPSIQDSGGVAEAIRRMPLMQQSLTSSSTPLQNTGSQDNLGASQIVLQFLPMPVMEVGMCHLFGWGVPTNRKIGAHFLFLAAELDDVDAQQQMGYLMMRGDGVRRSKHEAARYFRLASLHGRTDVNQSWIWKAKYNPTRPLQESSVTIKMLERALNGEGKEGSNSTAGSGTSLLSRWTSWKNRAR